MNDCNYKNMKNNTTMITLDCNNQNNNEYVISTIVLSIFLIVSECLPYTGKKDKFNGIIQTVQQLLTRVITDRQTFKEQKPDI